MGEAVAVLACGNAVCEHTLPCGCGGVSITDGCISWTRRQWWEVGGGSGSKLVSYHPDYAQLRQRSIIVHGMESLGELA